MLYFVTLAKPTPYRKVLQSRHGHILLLLFRIQSIQFKGQYLNCDSIKDLKTILIFLAGEKLRILERTLSFLFAFEQILFTFLSNFKSLSFVISRSSTFLLFQNSIIFNVNKHFFIVVTKNK